MKPGPPPPEENFLLKGLLGRLQLPNLWNIYNVARFKLWTPESNFQAGVSYNVLSQKSYEAIIRIPICFQREERKS